MSVCSSNAKANSRVSWSCSVGIALAQELCSDSCDNAVLRVLHGPEGSAAVSLNIFKNAVGAARPRGLCSRLS